MANKLTIQRRFLKCPPEIGFRILGFGVGLTAQNKGFTVQNEGFTVQNSGVQLRSRFSLEVEVDVLGMLNKLQRGAPAYRQGFRNADAGGAPVSFGFVFRSCLLDVGCLRADRDVQSELWAPWICDQGSLIQDEGFTVEYCDFQLRGRA